jgi:hypothetical protein
MTNWRTRLREADPGLRDEMTPANVQQMRAVVVATARDAPARTPSTWPRSFALTTAAFLIVCTGILAGLHQVTRDSIDPVTAARQRGSDVTATGESTGGDDVERQQLQFSTPGGTRIIWVFDARYDVKGTLP